MKLCKKLYDQIFPRLGEILKSIMTNVKVKKHNHKLYIVCCTYFSHRPCRTQKERSPLTILRFLVSST